MPDIIPSPMQLSGLDFDVSIQRCDDLEVGMDSLRSEINNNSKEIE